MSFRYGYTGYMKGADAFDADGYPIEGQDTAFACDYQPTAKETTVNTNAGLVPVSYKLFVPKSNKANFEVGQEVNCNGCKGVIVLIFPTALNTEIWVK